MNLNESATSEVSKKWNETVSENVIKLNKILKRRVAFTPYGKETGMIIGTVKSATLPGEEEKRYFIVVELKRTCVTFVPVERSRSDGFRELTKVKITRSATNQVKIMERVMEVNNFDGKKVDSYSGIPQ
uniref:Uncharacterized protein n=1 Tax=Panagrolaimus superbus TaxID=310955 RepID=A0A914XSJ4_9BILA